MLLSPGRTDPVGSLGLLVLRAAAGGFMAVHGWGKVQMLFSSEPPKFPFPDPFGLGPTMSLVGAAGAEFVCSLLVLVGFATRLSAIPVVFTMAVAAFYVHASDPIFARAEGNSKEPALLFLLMFLALVFTGAGAFSLDAVLSGRRPIRVPAPAPANPPR